jgi:hypothetical protein
MYSTASAPGAKSLVKLGCSVNYDICGMWSPHSLRDVRRFPAEHSTSTLDGFRLEQNPATSFAGTRYLGRVDGWGLVVRASFAVQCVVWFVEDHHTKEKDARIKETLEKRFHTLALNVWGERGGMEGVRVHKTAARSSRVLRFSIQLLENQSKPPCTPAPSSRSRGSSRS